MANYSEMTAYELEQELDRLHEEMMACDDDMRIESLADDIERVVDELESRDTQTDD